MYFDAIFDDENFRKSYSLILREFQCVSVPGSWIRIHRDSGPGPDLVPGPIEKKYRVRVQKVGSGSGSGSCIGSKFFIGSKFPSESGNQSGHSRPVFLRRLKMLDESSTFLKDVQRENYYFENFFTV